MEANVRGKPATIAVVDRVGNVLGVFKMNGANDTVTITSGRAPKVQTGLENVDIVPSTLASIAKAITGAYLSSEGNAFTTRTANQIIQEHFNPGERGQPGGPLFGVQFSNLPCSDFNTRFLTDGTLGPKRSPLGFSADPGGLPLYKNGTPVGGIGISSDGIYGGDASITNQDYDDEELIAVAGLYGFLAPKEIRANRISVDGKLLRFTDRGFASLLSDPRKVPGFSIINSGGNQLVAVRGYTSGSIENGVIFGQSASGIRADNGEFFPGQDVFVLVTQANANRYPPKAGSNLTQVEVQGIISQALAIAEKSRAQIRRPLSSKARVSVSVVDIDGEILGIGRTRDAPVFGTDVSLQKARTAVFFSSQNASVALKAANDAIYLGSLLKPPPVFLSSLSSISSYVVAAEQFFNDPNVLTGRVAFSDRAGGNLSRPFYPDGLNGRPNGPFSKPFPQWSQFSTGLQLDLIVNNLLAHVAFVRGDLANDVGLSCTNTPTNTLKALLGLANIPEANFQFGSSLPQLKNGIQIFPGSVPIYRNNLLVGGIGVSGDGIEQDDMVAFLGLHYASLALGTINNAPSSLRADNLTPKGVRLRFVQCPVAPFINSELQNVCNGK